MINQIKQHLKSNYPNFYNSAKRTYFALRHLYNATYEGVAKKVSLVPFWIAMWNNRPYFGRRFSANQTIPIRVKNMKLLIQKELAYFPFDNFQILEIGSWAGSSAVIWASACKQAKKGKVYCVDPWKMYGDGDLDMKKALTAADHRVLKLFLHNIRTSNLGNYVTTLIGSSDEILEMLQEKTFDFIYIDGDHRYTQFIKDLRHAARLVKDGGIICGDDLDLPVSVIDIECAKNHKDESSLLDPKTKGWIHPGIAVEIAEFFPHLDLEGPFWAVRKTPTGWQIISFKQKDL